MAPAAAGRRADACPAGGRVQLLLSPRARRRAPAPRRPEVTGGVAARPVSAAAPATAAGELPADGDLAFARAAASEALAKDGKTTSVPWENPRTGARGTVTPLAGAYTQDGFVCRDFLASYVRQGTESWLQGGGAPR